MFDFRNLAIPKATIINQIQDEGQACGILVDAVVPKAYTLLLTNYKNYRCKRTNRNYIQLQTTLIHTKTHERAQQFFEL